MLKQFHPVILASGSPRRKALLQDLGLEFTVVLKQVDENYPTELKREEVALFLAKKKSSAYAKEIAEGNVVITADTIVCVNDEILNKPDNFSEAFEMLRKLSGRDHQVITAVCLGTKKGNICFHVSTTVVFRQLTDAEITFYINKQQPYDKAGGYGIQEWIGLTGIEKIEGSYYNVVGLPVKELFEKLISLEIISIG